MKYNGVRSRLLKIIVSPQDVKPCSDQGFLVGEPANSYVVDDPTVRKFLVLTAFLNQVGLLNNRVTKANINYSSNPCCRCLLYTSDAADE